MREGRSLAGGNPDHVRVWRRCKGFGAAHADAPCSATNAARHSAAAGIRPTKAPQCLWRAPQPMSARPARTPDCRAASLHTYTRAEMHTCARFIGITHRFPFGLSWPACARRATELRRGECMSCGLVRPDRSVRSAPSARSVGTLRRHAPRSPCSYISRPFGCAPTTFTSHGFTAEMGAQLYARSLQWAGAAKPGFGE